MASTPTQALAKIIEIRKRTRSPSPSPVQGRGGGGGDDSSKRLKSPQVLTAHETSSGKGLFIQGSLLQLKKLQQEMPKKYQATFKIDVESHKAVCSIKRKTDLLLACERIGFEIRGLEVEKAKKVKESKKKIKREAKSEKKSKLKNPPPKAAVGDLVTVSFSAGTDHYKYGGSVVGCELAGKQIEVKMRHGHGYHLRWTKDGGEFCWIKMSHGLNKTPILPKGAHRTVFNVKFGVAEEDAANLDPHF